MCWFILVLGIQRFLVAQSVSDFVLAALVNQLRQFYGNSDTSTYSTIFVADNLYVFTHMCCVSEDMRVECHSV